MGVKKYHNEDDTNEDSDKSLSKLETLKEEAKQSIKKDPLERDQQQEIMDELLEQDLKTQQKNLNSSLDKILLTHRNSKMFLFMLTGPFFIMFTAFKYTIKFGVLMYIWQKKKVAAAVEGSKQMAQTSTAS